MPVASSSQRAGAMETRSTGFSLIELMVAVTIGLLLILALASLLAQQSRSRAELEKSAAQVENGRYAVSILQSDIELAGYYGQFAGEIAMPGALPDACNTTDIDELNSALALPLQGYSDVGATIPATLSGCIADEDHVDGTDILVVRRLQASDVLPSIADAASSENGNRVYVQANPEARITDLGENSSSFTLFRKDGVTAAELRAMVVHIYFVSPCNEFAAGESACDENADGGNPIPTLKRLELAVAGGATAFAVTPLVEGVEDMQFDYGVDAAGSGAPGDPFIEAPALGQWPNVVAVNTTLLVRAPAESIGHSDAKVYDLGLAGTVGPFDDSYKRHVYRTSVRVINVSGKRE